jgi:hypothetical protein
MKKGHAMIGKNEEVIYYTGKIYELKELNEFQALRDNSKYPLVLDCFPKANLRQDKSLPASFIFSNFFSLGIKFGKMIVKDYGGCQTY